VRVSDYSLLDALYDLPPREFEHQVTRLLEAEGYHDVRDQGGATDQGVDIVCRDPDGRLVAVQCKRFAPTSTVSALVVQHLVGMAVKRKAHRAMLVTTGRFTNPARTYVATTPPSMVTATIGLGSAGPRPTGSVV
jgi:HJR/Mrr/RecB family endonuclease